MLAKMICGRNNILIGQLYGMGFLVHRVSQCVIITTQLCLRAGTHPNALSEHTVTNYTAHRRTSTFAAIWGFFILEKNKQAKTKDDCKRMAQKSCYVSHPV